MPSAAAHRTGRGEDPQQPFVAVAVVGDEGLSGDLADAVRARAVLEVPATGEIGAN